MSLPPNPSKIALKIGDQAPDFSLPAVGGQYPNEQQVSLKDYQGKKLVLYFYPKDMTSGCTKQAEDFRDFAKEFSDAGVHILGVSKDSIARHLKFIEKHQLNFTLGSDEEAKMLSDYGVWAEKSMYGKKYMGIERSTFLIDKSGNIAAIWSKVKVPNHVQTVLAQAKAL